MAGGPSAKPRHFSGGSVAESGLAMVKLREFGSAAKEEEAYHSCAAYFAPHQSCYYLPSLTVAHTHVLHLLFHSHFPPNLHTFNPLLSSSSLRHPHDFNFTSNFSKLTQHHSTCCVSSYRCH